jgi:hypothetical protein
MVLVIGLETMKEEFIIACGGPAAPVGNNGATAADLGEALDNLIEHLVSPGARVYEPRQNRDKFWSQLINAVK